LLEKILQGLIGGISAGKPNYSRWRTIPTKQINEIRILGNYDRIRVAGRGIDLPIRRVTQVQTFDGAGFNLKPCLDPAG